MKPNHARVMMFALGLLCWLVAAAPRAQAQEQAATAFDRWYVMQVEGEHAGYLHTAERHKAGRIITQTEMKLTISRGGTPITVTHDMWFVETDAGEPVEASSTLNPGAAPIVQRYVFKDDHVQVTTGTRVSRADRPDAKFRPPAAAQRRIAEAIARGDQQVTAHMLDLTMGVTPVTMTAKLVGRENVEVFGKVVPAIVWESSVSMMPGMTVREYVDDEGRAIKTSLQAMPGMEVTIIEADEQLAKAEVDPPRVMVQTLIRPDRPIPDARRSRGAVYRLTVRGAADDAAVSLHRGGFQRVVWSDRATAAVVLDLDEPVNAIDDLPTDADLASSDMIDHADPAVRQLLERAVAGVPDGASDHEVASRLRGFVHGYIDEKDLSVGLARAGEVARTAQGDCTEHGVLLAALLRARGIPARTVTGLIYIDEFLGQRGVFGYHMWTQAWITDPEAGTGGGRWVDYDAVLSNRDFDAAHIALTVSSMADGQMINDLIQMLPTFGRLSIQVQETR